MTVRQRYRTEEGRACIDVHLESSRQLFDNRDPAPFRERDLDEHAVEYLVSAVQELPPKVEPAIILWIAEGHPPRIAAEHLVAAVRAHFAHEIERLDRQVRQHLRLGHLFLVVGLSALVVFLSLAELTLTMAAGHLRQILREGLVITGWVAMWRPLEVLLYDWWPLVQQRKLARRMLEVPVTVRYERKTGPVTA